MGDQSHIQPVGGMRIRSFQTDKQDPRLSPGEHTPKRIALLFTSGDPHVGILSELPPAGSEDFIRDFSRTDKIISHWRRITIDKNQI